MIGSCFILEFFPTNGGGCHGDFRLERRGLSAGTGYVCAPEAATGRAARAPGGLPPFPERVRGPAGLHGSCNGGPFSCSYFTAFSSSQVPCKLTCGEVSSVVKHEIRALLLKGFRTCSPKCITWAHGLVRADHTQEKVSALPKSRSIHFPREGASRHQEEKDILITGDWGQCWNGPVQTNLQK